MNDENKGWRRRRQLLGEALQTFMWLLTTAGLICGVLYGKKLTLFAAMALVMIQIFLWILFHTAFGSKASSGESRSWFSKKQGICMWGGLSLLFFLAMMVVLFKPSFFYNLVFEAEGYASGRIWQMMGRETMIGGDIDRGNNHRIGTKQLEVFLTEVPGEPLYLKGFSGGNYQGSRWEAADDEALFEETAQRLNWKRWASMVGGMFRSMYFVLNYDTRRDKPPVYREMYIRPLDDSSEMVYVPYYSRNGGMEDKDRDKWKEGQRYQYFEQRDMDILCNGQSNGLGEGRVWYWQLQAEYLKAAERAYTQVPSELLPKMARLVRENPRDSLDEITAFIQQTLQDGASYTLTPGWTPLNQDVVEYFLFENGQGYCQHFATAAALMYRMYGIPARYAAGYVLYPSDFSKQEDGLWKAEATDESCHAWVELFLEDYGWTPVEMTPGDDGRIHTSYPGLDGTVFRLSRMSEELQTDRKETDSPGIFWEKAGQKTGEGYGVWLDYEKHREFYLILGTCLFCVVIFAPVLLDYRKLKSRQKLERMDCRQAFSAMTDMLHCAGYVQELEGWEKEFPQRVSKAFPEVAEEELHRVQEIVEEAAYGAKWPEGEKEQYVRWICLRLEELILKRRK